FDIHRSYKFCPVVIEKSGTTEAIKAAFMRRKLSDWEDAEEFVLDYPREQVERFSPFSKSILEIRTDNDLKVLKQIYGSGVLLGDQSHDGWELNYQQGDFNLTSDSRLFPI